jgi:hypothetical protein
MAIVKTPLLNSSRSFVTMPLVIRNKYKDNVTLAVKKCDIKPYKQRGVNNSFMHSTIHCLLELSGQFRLYPREKTNWMWDAWGVYFKFLLGMVME